MKALLFKVKSLLTLVWIMYVINLNAQNTWTRKADYIGSARYVACSFSIGHYGFVGCGSASSGYVSDFYKWDETSDIWSAVASYPGKGKYLCTSFAIGGKGYVGLGFDGSPETDLWSYDTATGKWTQMASFPGTPRYDTKAFVVGTNAYVMCGYTGANYLQDVWEYNSVTNTWKQKNNWPGGVRGGAIAFTLNNKGYAGCGSSSDLNSDNKKDLWQYDTTTDSWTQMTSLPISGVGVDDASVFVMGGKVYVGTGDDQSSNPIRKFWSYDPGLNQWSVIDSMGGARRGVATGFTIGNKGYIATGRDSANGLLADLWQYAPDTTVVTSCDVWTKQVNFIGLARYTATSFSIGHYGFVGCGEAKSGYVSDFYRWNQDSNKWDMITSYPGKGRYLCTSFTIGGKGYVGLGFNGSSPETDLWSYDTVTGQWIQMASFPGTPRYDARAFVIGVNAYIMCGYTGANYLQDVWEYNSVTNTWKQKNNWPGGVRGGAIAFTLNNKGYAGCGSSSDLNSDNKKDLWQYDTTTDSWTQMTSLPISGVGVDDASVFVIGGKAYVGTGDDQSSNPIRKFWSYDPGLNQWSVIDSMGGARRGVATGFTIGNKGYIATGRDSANGLLADLWQYYPCSDTILTSITSPIQSEKINIYPNPSKDIVNLSYEGLNTDESECKIIDVYGRVINSYMIYGKKGVERINVSNLNSGIYFYQLISEGKMISDGKFIIVY